MMDTKQLIAALEMWATDEDDYQARKDVLCEAARRLVLAEELIANLEGHEGAEGFSASTYKLLDKWDGPLNP